MFRRFSSKIRTVPMSPEYWNFLRELFAGSKECSECWCMNHRSAPDACPTGPAAKAALQKAIGDGSAKGVLAFVGEKPVGWCAVDSSAGMIGHDYVAAGSARDGGQWMIHCLFVAGAHRGQGVSRALIEGAIHLAREHGAQELLAFPIPEENKNKFPPEVGEFSGRMSTFEKVGFRAGEKFSDFYQVMRLSLEKAPRPELESVSWSNL